MTEKNDVVETDELEELAAWGRKFVRSVRDDLRKTVKADRPHAYMQSQHDVNGDLFALAFGMLFQAREELRALKARPVLTDRGVWSAEQKYQAGDAVSFRGGLWIARVESTGLRPGDGGVGWRLAVKKGAAG
jgi:hypothetical protein